jgi:predicted RNA binding protein YcfA (HicA-like mRNA interferase family)
VPKVPAFTPEEIVRILLRRGFVLDRSKGSHRIYIHPQTRRRVVVPFHAGDLPKGTFHEILRQAGISRDDWLNL